MRRKHLVCYDYGQGGLWAYIYAESPEEIQAKFRDLEVIAAPPAWLTSEEQEKLEAYDVDCPDGWLAKLSKR
jgi:hypothetical protein